MCANATFDKLLLYGIPVASVIFEYYLFYSVWNQMKSIFVFLLTEAIVAF